MCIAILQKKNKPIKKKYLENSFDYNDDGFGIMWAQDNKLCYIKKVCKTFEEVYKIYNYVNVVSNSDIVLHFRIRTDGDISKDNCHPFLVNSNLGFVHNGIISSVVVKPEHKMSDTAVFNECYLKRLPKGFLKSPKHIFRISKFIGSYNKLIFLNNKGESKIINEDQGIWHGDNWFSNESYFGWYGNIHSYSSNTTVYRPKQQRMLQLENNRFTEQLKRCVYCGEILIYQWETVAQICDNCNYGYYL